MLKFFWIVLFLMAGCATSLPKALDSVRVGMDKDRVLELAGDPSHTYRADDTDHWAYTFFVNDQEMRREIVFAEGKVVKISPPMPRQDWVKELENTTTMEEYEQKVREHQKKASGKSP